MKLGLLAYSTDTGLGHQTWEFFNHMNPDKTLVIDISKLNKMPQHPERFPGARIFQGLPDCEAMTWLLKDMDAVFVCENPLNYCLFEKAPKYGVKTIQQYNYEFLDYFRHPNWARPDIFAAPTVWNKDIVEGMGTVIDWPVPVNRNSIQFREITECQTFVHIIGRPAFNDRNGTIEFLEAAKKLGKGYNYKIFLQPPKELRAIEYFQPVRDHIEAAKKHISIQVIEDTPDYRDIYKQGDVLVMPRKYGGLCLPMQEALAAGMPVIMTDLSPNNARLPKEWLCEATFEDNFRGHTEIAMHKANTQSLYEVMRKFTSTGFMRHANRTADELAEQISWSTLKPIYTNLIEGICQK